MSHSFCSSWLTRAASAPGSFGNQIEGKQTIDAKYQEPTRGSKLKRLDHEIRNQERADKKLEKCTETEKLEQLQKERLAKAQHKLTGEAVKDNVAKLKATKKQLLKRKEKSAKQWADKETRKNDNERKKQDQRTENLSKARGKRRARQGFEGTNVEVLPRRDVTY